MRDLHGSRVGAAALALALAGCELFGGATPDLCQHDTAPFLETERLALPAGFEQAKLAVGDLDGDGVTDLVAVSAGGQALAWSLEDSGPRLLVSPRTLDAPTPPQVTGVALLDTDGDGHDEVLVLSGSPSRVLLLEGADFSVRQRAAAPAGAAFLTLADVDGDGQEEVVVGGAQDHQVAVYALGAGSLGAPWQRAVAAPLDGLLVEDLDGDGLPELVTSSFDPGSGQGSAHVYPPYLPPGADGTPSWSGFDTSWTETLAAAGPRFALAAASFERHPAQQLLAVDQGMLRLWRAQGGPQLPAQGAGFTAGGVTTLDVDGDLRQDVFTWNLAPALDGSGNARLGAVAYGEPGAFSPPRPIDVQFSPRGEVLPLLRHQPWSLELAVVGMKAGPDGGPEVPGVHLLRDLCARPSNLTLLSVGPAAQVVQSLDGSVPLFGGKPTAVPVTVASRHGLRHPSVRVELVDAQDALVAELPLGKPRPARIKPGLEGRVVFQAVVPPALATEGSVRVRAQVVAPAPAANGDPSDDLAATSFTLQHSRPFSFGVVSWRHQQCPADQHLPNDFSACSPTATLSTLPAQPQARIDDAVPHHPQVFPAGAVSFPILEQVDPDFSLPQGAVNQFRVTTAVVQVRTRFNQAHPELASAPVYFLTSGSGAAPTLPSLTAWGDASAATHEAGHMAGARHVLCTGNPPDGPDPTYPYPGGIIGGPDGGTRAFSGINVLPMAGGWWAQPVSPDTCDLMSYGQPRWPSDWTYRYLQQAVASW